MMTREPTSAEVVDKSKRQLRVMVVRPGHRQTSLIANGRSLRTTSFTVLKPISKIQDHPPAPTIDIAHQLDLLGSFLDVALIDAESINPEVEALLIVMTDISKSTLQIYRDVISTPSKNDGSSYTT